MTLLRYDPFRDFEPLAEQSPGRRAPRTMPMEAFRRGEEFVVALDLPGVEPGAVDVTVERNVVSIRARRSPLHREGDEILIDERPRGSFGRQFFLGDNLDAANVTADFDRGVLTLTVPVSEASKPRQIPIARSGAAHSPDLPSGTANE
jgi:HSP20 family protein